MSVGRPAASPCSESASDGPPDSLFGVVSGPIDSISRRASVARFDAKPQLLAVSSILLCSSWTTFDEDLIV